LSERSHNASRPYAVGKSGTFWAAIVGPGYVGTLAAWGELSGAYGGMFVFSGHAVLSLRSGKGIANSAEIAPAIADVVGGEARGD
jgi:hypothetical protein